jgi:hypothetical protein
MAEYDHTKINTLEAIGVERTEYEKYKEVGKQFLQDTLSYKAVSEIVELTMTYLLNPMPERLKALMLYINVRYLSFHGLVSESKESISESLYGFDHKADKIYEALQMTKVDLADIKKFAARLVKNAKEFSPSKLIEFIEKELLYHKTFGIKEKAIALAYLFVFLENETHELDDMLKGMEMALEGDELNNGF